MALSDKHPLYVEHEADWRQMRHTYRGERMVKQQAFDYLPPTSGMIQDGIVDAHQKGWVSYDSYRKRARFPDSVREAVEAMLGVMHRKPPAITLPAALEPMRLAATIRGDSLETLLRKVNEEQLVAGRVGILGDVVDAGPNGDNPKAGRPYVVIYTAERIINWDEGARGDLEPQSLNLVVLDETENERQPDFTWREVAKHRVLVLGDLQANEPAGAAAKYQVGVFRERADFSAAQLTTPTVRGTALTAIPFAFANTKDVVAQPDDPPLLGLSNLALSIYRGEADYRQSLFMQGQDTLVVIGATSDSELRVGANAAIKLPIGGDAKFIGVEAEGLTEQREALENDYRRAGVKGGELVDATSRQKESGEALRVRVAARTTTLVTIAKAGALALEIVLKAMAAWVGADPDEVEVVPHLDFADDLMAGKELAELMTSKSLGAPLSLRSVHAQMRARGVTELTYEEELEAIEREAEEAPDLGPGPGSTDPDGPGDDAPDDDEGEPPEDDEGEE